MRDLCELYNIKLTFSSVNHSQSNGSTEGFKSTLLEMIRTTLTDRPEDHLLTCKRHAVILYNNFIKNKHDHELIFRYTNSKPPEKLSINMN